MAETNRATLKSTNKRVDGVEERLKRAEERLAQLEAPQQPAPADETCANNGNEEEKRIVKGLIAGMGGSIVACALALVICGATIDAAIFISMGGGGLLFLLQIFISKAMGLADDDLPDGESNARFGAVMIYTWSGVVGAAGVIMLAIYAWPALIMATVLLGLICYMLKDYRDEAGRSFFERNNLLVIARDKLHKLTRKNV